MTAAPDLEIRDLVVSGDTGRLLLDVPGLSIAAGEAVCLRGASGAGKTTLLHVIAGLVAPRQGQVLWAGRDIAAMPAHAAADFRRRHVGFVFQEHLLFDELTAAGNAALAACYAPRRDRATIRASARTALDRLGVAARADARSAFLSGGERQRVAVARALAGEPTVILADEPTASLDRANADRLTADLVGLARGLGRTLIVASHDPHLHAAVDRVIDLADGRLAAPAPTEVVCHAV